jgi:hypothetical protein
MLFMNEYEIENAVMRYALQGDEPVLGPAAVTLRNLMDWANRNSDGWAYWPKPCRAAEALQQLFPGPWDDERPTVEQYRAALRPIKAFRTRQGADFEIVEAGA